MSDPIAIKVDQLSKRYRIGRREQRKDTLVSSITGLLRAPLANFRNLKKLSRFEAEEGDDIIWPLRDISFDVKVGEVVGIVGRNGAGKSTLLKILSRITEPTHGRIEIRGRVSSLLEVGTGFNMELTGRENVFLNGTILGMTRKEVERKFDEIVAFSGVEKFIDTPVKRYSSGMKVRLAFAVAAHLEPEILLIDEVLAVGDAAFQEKCLGKMKEVSTAGRTVLFVSHHLQTVTTLTTRSVVLHEGRLGFVGNTPEAIRYYRNLWNYNPSGEFIDENKKAGVVRARVVTSEPNQIHQYGKPLAIEFDIKFDHRPKVPSLSFQVVDDQMRPVVDLLCVDSDLTPWAEGLQVRLRCELPSPRLYMGNYSLVTWLSDRSTREIIETLKGVCSFDIVMDGLPRAYQWVPGACAYLEEGTWASEALVPA